MHPKETRGYNQPPGLEPLPEDEPVLTKVKPGTKKGDGTGWNDPENLLTAEEAREWVADGGNVGVRLGLESSDGRLLVVLDVEDDGALPDAVADLIAEHTLATWTSPHGGRNRLLAVTHQAYTLLDGVPTKIDLDGDDNHELELLTNGHALGPGSILDHEQCRSGKPGCPGEGHGVYQLVFSDPNAEGFDGDDARELLDLLGVDADMRKPTADGYQWEGQLPELDASLADEGEVALRTLQQDSTKAFNVLSDLLQGGTGCYEELLVENGEIDRSLQDLMALTRLFGTIRFKHGVEDEERALAIARATFESFVREHPYTKDGQPRRWHSDGEDYRMDRLRRAAAGCDRGKFQRLLNLNPVEGERERRTGDYSRPTYGHVRFALDLLTGVLSVNPDAPDLDGLRKTATAIYEFDLDAEKLAELLKNPPTPVHGTTPNSGCVPPSDYPEQNEVITACQQLDPSRDEGTHEGALRRLRRDGVVAQARVGRQYFVYPSHRPDPAGASMVRCGGEKRDLETIDRGEGHLMTDGGVPVEGAPEETDMSTTQTTTTETNSTTDYTEEQLRERTEHVVVSRTNRGRVVHFPDDWGEAAASAGNESGSRSPVGDGTEEEAEHERNEAAPLCGTADRGRGWQQKDLACYPKGHKSICRRCADRVREHDRRKAPRAPSEPSPTVAKWENEHGNALEAEWG